MKQIGHDPPAATYRDVCLQLGILNDDGEWRQAMKEASEIQFPWAIRQLFCIILEWCNPSDPTSLFHDFKVSMTDDYERLYQHKAHFSNDIKFAMLSLHIEQWLIEKNMTLNFDFLNISKQLRAKCTAMKQDQQSSFRLEQMEYDPEQEFTAFQENYRKLDPEQRVFVDHVISSINTNSGKIFSWMLWRERVKHFVKTFCFHTHEVNKKLLSV